MNYHPLVMYIVEQGVPLQTLALLLMIPVVAFFRQVVGIKAFGIYTPSIITFALLAFDPNGLKYGIAIFISIILVGMASRYMLRRFRLLYLPRVAITISIVALAILLILVIGAHFKRTGLASVSIFPLLIMITLAEKFVATQIEKGSRAATFLAGETFDSQSSLAYPFDLYRQLYSWQMVWSSYHRVYTLPQGYSSFVVLQKYV